ncbi:MAG TPA: hypothetical protein V6C72_11180, partial [Chroococcales cyanobacterium]
MPNRINFLVISFTLTAVCSLVPGLCGQLPAAEAADDGATAPAGSVQSEKEQLENMAETLKRVVKAASELKGEASHQGINPEDELDQMIMNPFPNFYAPGMNTTGKG